MKILVDSNIPRGEDLFSPYGTVASFEGRHLNRHDLSGVQALIIRSVTKIDKPLLENTAVKFVGSCTIGTDHVDISYLKKRGIHFAYAPGCNCNAVGDYIISSLLILKDKFGLDYGGQTLGIIGHGNVGKNLAGKAQSLGLRILVNDPPLYDLNFEKQRLSTLARLQQEADILSFHVPLTLTGKYQTKKMFNTDFLNKIEKPVIVFNSSRGNVMDEDTLLKGKKSGKIKHLILDVFPDEPRISAALAETCDLITPHIAGYSIEGKMKGSLDILEAFTKYFKLPDRDNESWMTPSEILIQWQGESDDEFLIKLCEQAFSFVNLDKDLRSGLLAKHPTAEFDLLRKNLTGRQDFTSYKVQGVPPSKTALREQLNYLKFKLDTISQTEAIT